MSYKFLIIDKQQRTGDINKTPYAIERLQEEIKSLGHTCDFAYNHEISIDQQEDTYKIYAKDIDITTYTHIMMRGHYSREEYEIKRLIVEHIDNFNKENPDKQIKIHNSEFIKIMHNYTKLTQALIFSQNNIPYLHSFYRADGNYNDYQSIFSNKIVLAKHISGENDLRPKKIDNNLTDTQSFDNTTSTTATDKSLQIAQNQDVIVKKNIYMINKIEDFAQDNLSNKELRDFFLQEFTDIGEDLRLFVKKDKLISGWIRKATNSFITVDKGEYSLLTNPEERLIELAKKCGDAFKSDFMAIDVIYKDNKPYVLEVNMNPGFKAYETKIAPKDGFEILNIAKEIILSFVNEKG